MNPKSQNGSGQKGPQWIDYLVQAPCSRRVILEHICWHRTASKQNLCHWLQHSGTWHSASSQVLIILAVTDKDPSKFHFGCIYVCLDLGHSRELQGELSALLPHSGCGMKPRKECCTGSAGEMGVLPPEEAPPFIPFTGAGTCGVFQKAWNPFIHTPLTKLNMDAALGNLIWLKMSLLTEEGLELDDFIGPF